MENYVLVEVIEDMWPSTPLGQVITRRHGYEYRSFFHIEHHGLWLRAGLTYQGSVMEEHGYIIDPRQRIAADRLLKRHEAKPGASNLFPLLDISKAIANLPGLAKVRACSQAVSDFLAAHNPETILRLIRTQA